MLPDFTLSRERSFSLGRANFIIRLSLSLSLFFPLARRIEHLAIRFLLPVVDCPFVCTRRRAGFIATKRRDERERERERWIHRSFLRGESLGRNNRVCEARGKTNRFERMEGRKVFWYCLREPGRLIKYWILSMKYRRKHPPPPSFPVDEKFERFSVNFSSILRFELLTSTFRYFGG